jgi:hypothetical protein
MSDRSHEVKRILEIGGNFDVIPGSLQRRLRGDMFRVIQMTTMVVENPLRNAHFLEVAKMLIEDCQDYLEEFGMSGDGQSAPSAVTREPDLIDLVGAYTAEGLSNFLRSRFITEDEGEEDNDG